MLPATVQAGLQALVDLGWLAALPPILGTYTVTNLEVLASHCKRSRFHVA